jgi:transposase
MGTTTAPGVQREFFTTARDDRDAVVVNDRVTVRTSGGLRVVLVDGLAVHHHEVGDRAAQAYAMVTLVESGYADQNDVARAFRYSARTLRRFEERYDRGGIEALGRRPGRPSGARGRGRHVGARDRAILGLKAEGLSNCEIARRLGITETAVRKRLKGLAWVEPDRQGRLFETKPEEAAVEEPPEEAEPKEPSAAAGEASSLSTDPLDRSVDRFFAKLGLLSDAKPVFAAAESLPRGGGLLAIPGAVESGIVETARAVYGERALVPAFYGLRTTIVALVLLALLRVKRPEGLKEHAPRELGRLLGLDRAPEVKTLRRKLAGLAKLGGAQRFGRELARRRVAARGRMLGFLYLDGHVRVYHGKHRIPKAHVARIRLAMPATTDYWVNDRRGDPLFVVTAEANAGMAAMLLELTSEARALLGPKRRATVVFDRGGWSPKLFAKLLARLRRAHLPQGPCREPTGERLLGRDGSGRRPLRRVPPPRRARAAPQGEAAPSPGDEAHRRRPPDADPHEP